jgi:hypothetical protein
MIWHSNRDPDGNLRYHLEHTKEDPSTVYSMLPKSQQFADTGRTLGIASRGFAFTGNTTENQGHDAAIHSSKSLLNDPRQINEWFVESRNGAESNPSFKTDDGLFQTTGPQPDATSFTPSQAAPVKQGGTGPSWWERIQENFRSNQQTQSSNLGTKPPEKFQVGLRSSNVKVMKQDQHNNPGPTGPSAGGVPSVGTYGTNTGVVGNISR